MDVNTRFKFNKLSTQLILAGMLSVSTITLTACHSRKPSFVRCEGLRLKHGTYINTLAGTCKKLAGGKPKAIKCDKWRKMSDTVYQCADAGSKVRAIKYPTNNYVKCYGVAAAGMNDCGTKSTACGGSVQVARSKDAWIAIPDGICQQIKGAVIGKVKS